MATTTGFIDYTQQGSTPSTPSASHDRLYFRTSDGKPCYVDSTGTVTVLATGSGGMTNPMTTTGDIIYSSDNSGTPARLAIGSSTAYLHGGTTPGYSEIAGTRLAIVVNTAGGNQTTTSATEADVDATNAVITFTAPASGNVVVAATCTVNISAANNNAFFGLREGTTNLGSGLTFACQGQTATQQEILVPWKMYLTGISAGSHTYKLAFAVNGGGTFISRASSASPMILEVFAA